MEECKNQLHSIDACKRMAINDHKQCAVLRVKVRELQSEKEELASELKRQRSLSLAVVRDTMALAKSTAHLSSIHSAASNNNADTSATSLCDFIVFFLKIVLLFFLLSFDVCVYLFVLDALFFFFHNT